MRAREVETFARLGAIRYPAERAQRRGAFYSASLVLIEYGPAIRSRVAAEHLGEYIGQLAIWRDIQFLQQNIKILLKADAYFAATIVLDCI